MVFVLFVGEEFDAEGIILSVEDTSRCGFGFVVILLLCVAICIPVSPLLSLLSSSFFLPPRGLPLRRVQDISMMGKSVSSVLRFLMGFPHRFPPISSSHFSSFLPSTVHSHKM